MMFALGTLTFSNLPWLWLAGGVSVLALGLLAWSYRAAPPGPWRWGCVGLKALGIGVLALCLLEPLWSGRRAKPGANLFVIVADNSRSLQVTERGRPKSRSQSLQALLGPDGGEWQQDLADHFDVRRFYFDSQLHATPDFGDLDFQGRSSALAAALGGLRERFQGRPLAGILLLTDGDATDWPGARSDLAGLPPIYPVEIGHPGGIRDIGIAQANVSQSEFEDAPVTVQAGVQAIGFQGAAVVAQLLDPSGHTIQEQTRRVQRPEETVPFQFRFRPDRPGLLFYQLRVGTVKELHSGLSAASSQEATLRNNRRRLVVDRGHGPHRILYVAGRPNWEYKFLNRALASDNQLQLVALIRVARREPKFVFRGRAGETGNPMFRGFGNQSREQVSRYDQPVLVRLNTRNTMELRGGFPQTAKQLYGYDAVVLDDVEAAFFSPDQQALLQKYVSERGGGFLMLGGMECFRQGHYQHTPIGEMLPVYLDRGADLKPPGPVRLALTREGWLQPWVRLRETESEEKIRLQKLPPFQVLNPVKDIKPGASLLETAISKNGTAYPALVTQRFGRGRTAALLIGDIWRWGFHDAASHQDMDKAWRQLMRWLVANVPHRVELSVQDATNGTPGTVQFQVRVRDAKFQPVDDAEVELAVQPVSPAGASNQVTGVSLRAEPSLNEAGLYEASFFPRRSGAYRVTACVTNAAGAEVAESQAGWTSDLDAAEFRSLEPNTDLLKAIARRTHGEIVPASKLAAFVNGLPRRHAPVMEAWTAPAWDTPGLFGFALGCFILEWGLRRWRGLP